MVFGSTRSGGREAEILTLAGPVQRKVLHPDELICHEIYWLATANYRLNDVRGEVCEAENAGEIGTADAVLSCQIGN